MAQATPSKPTPEQLKARATHTADRMAYLAAVRAEAEAQRATTPLEE